MVSEVKYETYWYGWYTQDSALFMMSPAVVRLKLINNTSYRYKVVIDWGDRDQGEYPEEYPVYSCDYEYAYHAYKPPDTNSPSRMMGSIRFINQEINHEWYDTFVITPNIIGKYGTSQSTMSPRISVSTTSSRVGNIIEVSSSISSGATARYNGSSTTKEWEWEFEVKYNNGSWTDITSSSHIDVISQTYRPTISNASLKLKDAGTYVFRAYTVGLSTSYTTRLQTDITQITGYSSSSPTVTVLAQPTPSIQLVSYHDAHGNQSLNGKAPFTATFKDTSMTTEPNQPAIVSRVWSFGDPESGFLNASTLQQQAHYFSGYGPYTVMLTITNNKGESASTTYTFAPNLQRRVTVDTAPTPRSGTAPLLVTCSVETAGSPEPVTTWTYTLNNDPGYYSGSKEGDFAELSLLAPGTYTITRTVSQEGQTALTRTWNNVTVTAPTPTAEQPQTMPEFMLWIYNAAGTQRTAQLDMATDIRIQWNFMTGKVLTFRVPAIYDGIQSLRVGTKLAVGFAGKARPFIIASRTDQQNSEYVEFECIDYAEAIMESRIALVATRSTSGNGYDIQTCSGEALMRYFAVANLNTGRTDSLFKVLGTNSDMDGTTVTYSARYETIDEIMSDICTACGLGWDVIINDGTQYIVGWKPVKGTDRTVNTTAGVTPVILAARLQTATISEFRESLSKTIAVGAGQGAGAARTYTPYNISGTASPAVTGIDRREVFVDAGDAADAVEVKRMAVQELKNGQQETLYVIPEETSPYRFGTDYFVGDFVTVEDPHIGRLNMRVLSADYSTSDNGTKLQLKCGTDQTNYSKLITAQKRQNSYARK